MGLFDDSAKLFNYSFPWAMGRYRPGIDDDPDRDAPPPDIDAISVYVDDEGVVNIDNKLVSYSSKDPIDVISDHTYSKDNGFIDGLRRTLDLFPLYGVVLYPTTIPGTRDVEGRYFLGTVYTPGESVRFPRDTPEGFVPCAGQVLKYPNGSGIEDVLVPNLVSVTRDVGDGGSSTTYFAPPGMAYMMRVPEGYVEMVPELGGRELRDFGAPGGYYGYGAFGA